MAAKFADDGEIVRRAKLDFVDGPTWHFSKLGDHAIDRVEADRKIRQRHTFGRESPQSVDGRSELLAPQVVCCLVERAECKWAVGEIRRHRGPKLRWIGELGRLKLRSDGLDRSDHAIVRRIVIAVRRCFAVAGVAGFAKLDNQRLLHADGAARNREGMFKRQVELVKAKLHCRQNKIYAGDSKIGYMRPEESRWRTILTERTFTRSRVTMCYNDVGYDDKRQSPSGAKQ